MQEEEGSIPPNQVLASRPLPLRMTLFAIFAFIIIGFYVSITLLYVTPNNPIRILANEKLELFEKWGYQRWTFFAPPPTSVDRLYFAFSPRSGSGKTIEVLEGIYARKQFNHPFNFRAQALDYAISGTASSVSDAIREIGRYRKVHEIFGGDPEYLNDLALRTLDPDDPSGRQIRVLLRFAAMIAKEQNLTLNELKCQIALTRVPLPPFSERFNKEYHTEEVLSYKTAVLDVPSLVVKKATNGSSEN